MNTPGTNNTSNPAIPTAAQLADARLKQWHQRGEALLTLENLRSWLNAAGLVLFAPRPQIASPAPTLVEAVFGAPTPNPTRDHIAHARALLGRLIAEGLAVPLNLLGPVNGAVGDTPDFVASAAVFSYVFTLRGDKAWKQPPATAGALKVSHLALATHEALTQRGPLSAFDLTTELGKEVTEAAVLRALNELWTHLRVLPLPQLDSLPTLWELAPARFTKQIKAGANAGQPSALSALISLYLGQALVAAEDEIETFLSPLAPRSRIRDVVHTLLSARQLDTLAIEGRTMLHVAGELPAFLAAEPIVTAPETQAAAGRETAPETEATVSSQNEGGVAEATEAAARITKFIPKPRKIGTGYLAKAKPIAPAPGFKPEFKPRFRPSAGPPSDRERRPFRKTAPANQPAFNKPWEEEKARRLAAARKPSEVSDTASDLAASAPASDGTPSPPRAPRTFKPRTIAPGGQPPFAGKPPFRGKPAFGDKPKFGSKPAFGGKPPFRSEGRPPRRDLARGDGAPGDARPPRKTFSKPGTFGRKREGFTPRPPNADARPPRREFSSGPTQRSPRGPQNRQSRPDRPDRASTGEGAQRVYRKFDARKFDAPRPGARTFRGPNPDGPRDSRTFAPRIDRPKRAFSPKSDDSAARSQTPGDFKRKSPGDFPPRKFTGKPSSVPRKFSGRPAPRAATGFKGKKPPGKSGAAFPGKPGSPFAKFVGNKKPFGKRPPARKFKPPKGESA
ncbi:MAG: hypothetical protein ABR910_04940 [Acidobacteriaceae bacterium]|jgi:hypothetical protein